jgi:outer membrane biosynthesis protein TonB
MTRVEKKCLIASTGMHAFLLLMIVFWSAIFVTKEKHLDNPRIRIVPTRFVEAALAGGGGNPKIPVRDEDVQKGQTLLPTATPTPVQPRPVEPTPPPPKPEPKKVQAPEAKVEPPKAEPVKKPVKAVDLAKPADKPAPKFKIDLSELQPVTRAERDKAKEKQQQAEAEARAKSEAVQRANAAREHLAKELGQTAKDLQLGFQNGTTVDVGGPGGEAYASYSALVQQAYDSAWQVLPDLSNQDFATLVRVTISREGRVILSQILRKSGNASMDKSVQRALDKVKLMGLPRFPDFIKDSERSFTIEFNLKTKKLVG